ncbi:hypothetical protein ACFO5T_01380 [Dokdonia genika]|uniref:Uncharacterized protein n=1 Tax=Dokdonia genika TaxID=308113 RepID=A0ABV9L4R3_9FLAO
MKKSIKADLVSLAHKILQLRDTADYTKLAATSRELHEKLTVLAYAEKLEKTGVPTIGLKDVEDNLEAVTSIETVKQDLFSEPTESEQAKGTTDHHRPDGTEYNDEDPVHEPVIEKIKDMWPEMAPEAADIDKVIDSIIPQEPAVGKNDSFTIGSEYGQTPIFEPKETTTETPKEEEKPKNLNDRLKTGLKIGLNDKLSFIKHLFAGSTSDYNRVLSQLETFASASEARNFITQMVKPDYNNWEGKEIQEERFMEVVESRYA